MPGKVVTRRQKIARKDATAKSRVNTANALTDPLHKSFRTYNPLDGTSITLKCSKVTDLEQETIVWIFDLMERNMKTMYEQSSWKWNPTEKQKELTENCAWYLIASDDNNELIGFSHFRFDIDYGVEVLYCYELQLEPKARRKGLGRYMMNALESMAKETLMQKVVLTVFKQNDIAIRFYTTLGYKLDDTSPAESLNLHYVILSKKRHLFPTGNATSIEKF